MNRHITVYHELMPGAGGPSATIAQYIHDIQTNIFSMISALASRIITLEAKVAEPHPAVTSSIDNYSGFSENDSEANWSPIDVLTMNDSIGSTTIGALPIGCVIIIKLFGAADSGSHVDLVQHLAVNGVDILSQSIEIPGTSGAFSAVFTISVRDTSAIVHGILTYDGYVRSGTADVAFDREIDHVFTAPTSWTDSESGGSLWVRAATIETKFLNI